MSDPAIPDWRSLFKAHLASARVSVLRQVLESERGPLNITPTSRILVSNFDTAGALLEWYTEMNNFVEPLPRIAVIKEHAELNVLHGYLQPVAEMRSIRSIADNEFTHAILHVHTDLGDNELVELLGLVHYSLVSDGVLVLSRRKRDGMAEILHAAGVKVPGRKSGDADSTSIAKEDETFMSLELQPVSRPLKFAYC